MTIHIDEKIREQHSEAALEYVFLHEVGHDQAHPLFRGILLCLYLITGLTALVSVIAVPTAFASELIQVSSIESVVVLLVVYLLLGMIGILPFIILSWIDEGYAELFAISKIGLQQYTDVVEELTSNSSNGVLRRIRYRIQYPPKVLVRWVAVRKNYTFD